MIDIRTIIFKLFKYLFIGFVVAVVSYVIPKRSLDVTEIVLISLSAASTISIVEAFGNPTMKQGVSQGFGLGTGIFLSPLAGVL